jgi:hypothetical protein
MPKIRGLHPLQLPSEQECFGRGSAAGVFGGSKRATVKEAIAQCGNPKKEADTQTSLGPPRP